MSDTSATYQALRYTPVRTPRVSETYFRCPYTPRRGSLCSAPRGYQSTRARRSSCKDRGCSATNISL